MGLDMHWFTERSPEEMAEALIKGESVQTRNEIGYFRKFHDLNTFMGSLYPEEHQESFNCVDLEINWDILAAMRSWSGITQELVEIQKEFEDICNQVEANLKQGRRVWYWPWW